jgi:hypothetical protein
MSKGGAGKVYFVLYLAVILELLIIIVERDEAEEGLMKKQKESMRIVESILTQLQSGAGTEGINTRPQDAIILSEKLPQEQQKYFKKFRTYFIEVGVTDVSSELNMGDMDEKARNEKMETLKKLSNVQELQYEIYHHPSTEIDPPLSPSSIDFKKVELNPVAGTKLPVPANSNITEPWELMASNRLELNSGSMKNYNDPIYDETIKTGDINKYAPQDSVNTKSVFKYSASKTEMITVANGKKLTKRAFIANFQPDAMKEGWYKLRFSSRTNRIMGISAEQTVATLKDDAKVNIGTVQLKVKDLRSVQRQLAEDLSGKVPSADEFAKKKDKDDPRAVEDFDNKLDIAKQKILDDKDENRVEKASKVDLYRYIAKLLAPGRYKSFDQNKGSIEIDIYVKKPDIQQELPDVTWEDREFFTVDQASKIILYLKSNLYDKATPTITFNNATYTPKKDPKGSTVKSGRWYVVLPTPTLKDPINKEETFTLTASLNNTAGQAKDMIDVTVFPTRLAVINEKNEDGDERTIDFNDEIAKQFKNNLEMGKPIVFNAVPFTNNKILNQFYTNIKIGEENKVFNKLSIGKVDKVEITPGVESGLIRMYWQNPADSNEKINIFPLTPRDGFAELEFSTPRPIITLDQNATTTLVESRNPVVSVTVNIDSPNPNFPTPVFSNVSFKIDEKFTKIPDYKIIPLKSENMTIEKNKYTKKFILEGRLPLKKNFAGSFKIVVSAKMSIAGSKPSERTFRTTIPLLYTK